MRLFTVTTTVFVPVQPAVVPNTVYVVVVVGDTVMGLIVAPVDQLYVVPPPAVSVELAPTQIGVGDAEAVITGIGLTVTITVFVLVHAPNVPTTVYVVVAVGDTVRGFEVPLPGDQT